MTVGDTQRVSTSELLSIVARDVTLGVPEPEQSMIRQIEEQADPEMVAISALAFIAEDPERLDRFLQLTGTRPETIRSGAQQPGFLSGVLQQVVAWEPWLLEFAAYAEMAPADVVRAADQLAEGT